MQAKATKIFGLDVAHDPAGSTLASLADAVERSIEARKYAYFDRALTGRTTQIDENGLREYLSLARFHPDAEEIARVKQFSMLHVDVLMLLRLFACASTSPVLEIGPYVGGSTVAICLGLCASGRGVPLISIEAGGNSADHQHLPSHDIFGDLKRNVAAAGIADKVHLILGRSRDPAVGREARGVLAGRQIGLIMIDADGRVGEDWNVYGELLSPQAIVVLDDYISDQAAEKAAHVKPWVDGMVADKRLRPLGIFGWGTWFGQVVA